MSGIVGRAAFSAGQFHYQSDGYRENNDVEHNIYTLFGQAALTDTLSVQAENRSRRTEQGDLTQKFDPDNFSRAGRTESIRTRRGWACAIRRRPGSICWPR